MSVGLDKYIDEAIAIFTSNLWSGYNNSFNGRSYRIKDKKGNIIPVVYNGTSTNRDYTEVFVTDKYDSIIHFDIEPNNDLIGSFQSNIAVNIFFAINIGKIYGNNTRAIEQAKADIMNALQYTSFVYDGYIDQEAYSGIYDLSEKQEGLFNMQPFYVIRIQTTIMASLGDCEPDTPIVKYKLDISHVGEGVTNPDTGVYSREAGTTERLIATEEAGNEFVKWTLNTVDSFNRILDVVYDGAKTAIATFRNIAYYQELLRDMATDIYERNSKWWLRNYGTGGELVDFEIIGSPDYLINGGSQYKTTTTSSAEATTPISLGDEEIINYNFALGLTNWADITGWTVVDGVMTYDGTQGTSQMRQDNVVKIGEDYFVAIEIVYNEGSGLNHVYLGSDTILTTKHLEIGWHYFYGTAAGAIPSVYITGRSGEVFKVNSYSAKKINKIPAYGTWLATTKKSIASGDNLYYQFISDGSNGYRITQTFDERIELDIQTSGVWAFKFFTATGYIDRDVSYEYKAIRLEESGTLPLMGVAIYPKGTIGIYIRGGSFNQWMLVDTAGGAGTNPITEDTHKETSFIKIGATKLGNVFSHLNYNDNRIDTNYFAIDAGNFTTRSSEGVGGGLDEDGNAIEFEPNKGIWNTGNTYLQANDSELLALSDRYALKWRNPITYELIKSYTGYDNVHLIFYGDSVTEGSYPYLTTKLLTKLGKNVFSFVDKGQPGYTADQLDNSFDTLVLPEKKDNAINILIYFGFANGSASAQSRVDSMNSIADKCRDNGIISLSLDATGSISPQPASLQTFIQEANDLLPINNRADYYYNVSKSEPIWYAWLDNTYSADGLHPTINIGEPYMAGVVANYVENNILENTLIPVNEFTINNAGKYITGMKSIKQ